jgi:hypothetical protein
MDYIVRYTHKIWEEGGIGLIYTHYSHNTIVHFSDGFTYGREEMVENTIQRLAGFADARVYADDVIWSGNDKDGFHSSHRVVSISTNTGYTIFGPPTGRRVIRRGVAHCFVKENRIVEEWIVHDGLSIIRQLGLDENDLARKFAAQDAARGKTSPKPLNQSEIERLRGQESPEIYPTRVDQAFDPEDFIRRSIHEIWNWRLLNKIKDYYVPTYFAYAPTQRELYGGATLEPIF